MKKISHEKLKKALNYNEHTGIFIRSQKSLGRGKVGDVAGSVTNRGYVVISIFNTQVRAHRLAWFYVYGVFPDSIDHINGIKTDNRIKNLRNVSQQENTKNRALNKNNKSGVSGVRWVQSVSKWISRISVGGKHIGLGYFDNKFDAVAVRKSAEKQYKYHKNHGRNKELF